MRSDNSIHLSQFVSGSITAVGTYCLISTATLPALFDPRNIVINASCLIVNGAAATTAGVGAWVIVDSQGNIRTITGPAFGAINALVANTTNYFGFPTNASPEPCICHGIGFAITTTITGGPLAYIEVTAQIG